MGKRRVGQHHGDLKGALLRAALELIEEGKANPSLREVARRAGVSPGAPYHHFDGHAGLMSAVALEGFEALHSALLVARVGIVSPEESLRAMVERYYTFALEHHAHYRTMFAPQSGTRPAELETRARGAFAELVGAVARARPGLPEADLLALTRQVWALSHGSVGLALEGTLERLGSPESREEAAREISDASLAMVRGWGMR